MAEEMYPQVLVSGQGAVRVAAVGDSLTYGYGLDNRKTQSYPALLAEKLGPHYQVRNYGLSGRSLQSTADFPYFQEKNAQLSMTEEPDIVLIMIGSNDTRPRYWNKERFEVEYRQMVYRYQALPSQPDIFLIIPPYVPTSRFGLNNQVIKEVLRPLIEQIASDCGVDCINAYDRTEGQESYYGDGLHLNALGNQVLAQLVFEKMMDR